MNYILKNKLSIVDIRPHYKSVTSSDYRTPGSWLVRFDCNEDATSVFIEVHVTYQILQHSTTAISIIIIMSVYITS